MENKNQEFLKELFEHILQISQGNNSITNDRLIAEENELQRQILFGLTYLFEDIQHSRQEQEDFFNSQRANDILKAKNEELEQFVNIASHDLQEPIRTTSMMMQMLQRNYSDKFDEEGLEMMKLAGDGLMKMRSQIRSLVEYSVIGRKRVVEKVNLGQIIEHCINELKGSDTNSQAEFIISPLPTINGYPIELRGIFLQLIGNSLKFVHQGSTPKIIISHSELDDHFQFSIADNGIGLDPRFSEKIYGMFEKLHGSGSFPGLGVGLALAKKIIESHNGKIWYELNEYGGTTFHFTISKNLV